MYELFRSLRRLREDLYHRIKNGGKIKLPKLKDRPEDIPILFYFFVKEKSKKGKEEEGVDVDIHFDVFDLLIRPELSWPHGIRQLQTVAKLSIEEAGKDPVNDKKFKITDECLENLTHSLDEDVLNQLRKLKEEEPKDKKEFLTILKERTNIKGEENVKLVLEHAGEDKPTLQILKKHIERALKMEGLISKSG